MKPKVGDFIVGRSPLGHLVVGPVIAIDEGKKLAVVGPWLPNSSGATIDSCKDVDTMFKEGTGKPEDKPPTKPTPPSK